MTLSKSKMKKNNYRKTILEIINRIICESKKSVEESEELIRKISVELNKIKIREKQNWEELLRLI